MVDPYSWLKVNADPDYCLRVNGRSRLLPDSEGQCPIPILGYLILVPEHQPNIHILIGMAFIFFSRFPPPRPIAQRKSCVRCAYTHKTARATDSGGRTGGTLRDWTPAGASFPT
ncbi:hypothetical protein GPALN_010919 [Globodera pallida]|nr:hypothetical protein GPALN_010919 [Globodera pallida]